MVSSTYAVELLKKALEIYTPSRKESVLARLIAEKASSELGFESVHTDDVGNVIATKGYGRPRMLLCGHMDTVPGQMPVRTTDGYIYGRGASDAKSPLIAMLLAASMVQREYGTVIFAGLVDEEGNATGVKNLVRSKVDADYAIFGEPSGIDNITIAYKGRLALRVTCDAGTSAHASAPSLAKNAIEEIFDVWGSIKSSIEGKNQGGGGKNGSGVTCCLTEIDGGSSHNVTPAKCKVTIDVRVPTKMDTRGVLEMLDRAIKDVVAKRGIKVNYRLEDRTEPFEADHTSPLVRALVLGVLDVKGKRPMLVRKTGTGDMTVLGTVLKIPVVTYGPGDTHSSHSAEERVSIEEYVSSIEVLKRTLYHLSRLHRKRKQGS
ncbi:MAG: M20/M25/M40 family metallo-hydrolase [Nitrososphaerales archaeon]